MTNHLKLARLGGSRQRRVQRLIPNSGRYPGLARAKTDGHAAVAVAASPPRSEPQVVLNLDEQVRQADRTAARIEPEVQLSKVRQLFGIQLLGAVGLQPPSVVVEADLPVAGYILEESVEGGRQARDCVRTYGDSGTTAPNASRNSGAGDFPRSRRLSPPARRRRPGAWPDTWRSSRPYATTISTCSASPDSTLLLRLNPGEPPWYGPVCPVVCEGRHREVPPYPDQSPYCLTMDPVIRDLVPGERQRDSASGATALDRRVAAYL